MLRLGCRQKTLFFVRNIGEILFILWGGAVGVLMAEFAGIRDVRNKCFK